jgi:hypothetical protein
MRLGKLGDGENPRRSSGEHPAAEGGASKASPEAKRVEPTPEPAKPAEPVVETKRVKSPAETAAERGSQSAYSKPTEVARAIVDLGPGAPKNPPGSESVKATVLLKAPSGGDSSSSLRPVGGEPGPGAPAGPTAPAAIADLARDTRFPEALLRDLDALLARRGQVALEGPTGVGKTHLARRFAAIFAGSPQRVRFVQLHPGYRYEDFVEARGPAGAGAVPGVFKTFASRAAADPAHRYVLVLDELGRGDSVGVLGEVFSLLEYRGEEAVLPYSREAFAVPKNLFVLATASTSGGRALDDAALRRRFHFLHLAPSAEILRGFLERNHPGFAWVADLFSELNRRLAKDGGPRAQLGQSVFMQPALDDGELERIFVYDVRPLAETAVREPARLADLDLAALRAAVGAPAGAARG